MTWTGGPWVVDTSAWARASEPAVAELWKEAARAGELIGCPIVTLELLYDARDRHEIEEVARALVAHPQAPITRTVTDTGIWAMRQLADQGPAGWHRVRLPDALIAAAASERGFGVCHLARNAVAVSRRLGGHGGRRARGRRALGGRWAR